MSMGIKNRADLRYPDSCMRIRSALSVAVAFADVSLLFASPEKPVWPLTLRAGLPAALPGWTPAPKDELPDENEIGKYVDVGRFFQRIESPTSVKQFRVAIQDYNGASAADSIRKAIAE